MLFFRPHCCSLLILAACLRAQTPPPAPDTLTFKNGEKLIGHFIRSNGSTVIFKSDSLGEINVDWSKIQELHSSQKFAVVRKDVKLGRRSDLTKVPKGTVAVTGQTVTLTPDSGTPVTMPVGDAAHVLDVPTFDKDVMHSPGWLQAWSGGVTAGVSIVEATQQSRTFTGAINLVRAIPTEDWLNPRNRTTFDFSASSGHLDQPNTPTVKTDILHADAEHDEYFRGKDVYGFVQTAFDHNYSQGLDLQQNYGGGIGWTVIKEANTTLDLKGSVNYARQSFQTAANDENLIGSIFSENVTHKFKKGIQFLEAISVTPSWNVTRAYAANASASINVPVYKRLTFTTAVLDTFLNDPPPGFKKNSFQLTTGLTYSLR
jgi:hypothetical protein